MHVLELGSTLLRCTHQGGGGEGGGRVKVRVSITVTVLQLKKGVNIDFRYIDPLTLMGKTQCINHSING